MTWRQVYLPGTGGAPAGGVCTVDAMPELQIVAAETNPAPVDAAAFDLVATYNETNALPVDAVQLVIAVGGETNPTPTDTMYVTWRVWANASLDNDASQTVPANANGQPDSAVCIVKTNNALADLSNPVQAWTSDFPSMPVSQPAGLIAKRLRMFFSIPARTLELDTLNVAYDFNSAPPQASTWNVIYLHTGTGAIDFLANGLTANMNAVSWANFRDTMITAHYLAGVVALPETSIRVDAWCLEWDTVN